jgi:hypothetical protein
MRRKRAVFRCPLEVGIYPNGREAASRCCRAPAGLPLPFGLWQNGRDALLRVPWKGQRGSIDDELAPRTRPGSGLVLVCRSPFTPEQADENVGRRG